MITTRRFVALAALVNLVAGCDAYGPLDTDEAGAKSAAIVNGSSYSGHAPVGMLTAGRSLCTATLIGARTVLTAAHCIKPGQTHYFTVGGRKYRASRAMQHPHYKSSTYSVVHDMGIIRLVSAPSVAPALISLRAPSVGQSLTLIGFGLTGENRKDSGRKRIGRNVVAEVTSDRIVIKGSAGGRGNICSGDSGGPSFATIGGKEVVVGVHSTKQGTCGTRGNDMRVDKYASWIDTMAGGDVYKGTPKTPTPPVAPPADLIPPKVVINSPTPQSPQSSRVVVRATITDNDSVKVAQLFIDGRGVGTRLVAPYEFAVTTTPGSHTLQVIAVDDAGNRGLATITVVVRDSAPESPLPPVRPATPDNTYVDGGGCSVANDGNTDPSLVVAIFGLIALAARRRA